MYEYVDYISAAAEYGALMTSERKFAKKGKYHLSVQAGYIQEGMWFNSKKKAFAFAEWCKGLEDFQSVSVRDKFGCRI